jgi:hypothetical protein
MSNINNYNYEENYHSSPEKLLLAALLERAIRDLLSCTVSKTIKRHAIEWFKGTKDDTLGISFQQCTEYLGLSLSRLALITNTIKEIQNDKQQTKGEKDRAGNCSLATRPWNQVCQKESTILRKGRRRVS